MSPTARRLAKIRSTWARTGAKDGWLATHYFDLTRGREGADVVDDKTWKDLELPKIFADLDTTVTPIGSQVLLNWLRTYMTPSQGAAEQYAIYDALRRDKATREAIQLKLTHLDADSNAHIADTIFGRPLERPPHYVLILLLSGISIAVPVGVFTLSWPSLLWLLVVAVNFVVFHVAAPHMDRKMDALKGCARLLRAGDRLAALRARAPESPALSRLARETRHRAKARRGILWFSLSQDSLILGTAAMFLNAAFLAELVAYIVSVSWFAHSRPVLASTFDEVGSLDASIAVASLLERCGDHCVPSTSDDSVVDLSDAYHPLLAEPVVNTISLEERSALITGSNMAGKTTFIKTVGVNVVFGRTLGFCFGNRAVLPRSTAMASIGGEHSVESGKSHYFAEIEAIRSFIRAADEGQCRIFLIDELFSGTNTAERIAAARAVLEYMSLHSQVLVTTHDVELQTLLGGRFDLYHFREDPDVAGFFDYELRPGPTQTRNAIRILARMGFPEEIVNNALMYAGEAYDS